MPWSRKITPLLFFSGYSQSTVSLILMNSLRQICKIWSSQNSRKATKEERAEENVHCFWCSKIKLWWNSGKTQELIHLICMTIFISQSWKCMGSWGYSLIQKLLGETFPLGKQEKNNTFLFLVPSIFQDLLKVEEC